MSDLAHHDLGFHSTGPADSFNVLAMGNPGVGKSTFLNSILGTVVFQSGVVIAHPVTRSLRIHTCGDVNYMDTPGLDDYYIRREAASEISKALQRGGCFKLFFVIRLASGRIVPSDLVTIRTILDAIEAIGVDTHDKYTILVNQCDQAIFEHLEDEEARTRLETALGNGTIPRHVGYMPLVNDASFRDNFLLPYRMRYVQLVKQAPQLVIPENRDVEIDATTFLEQQSQLATLRQHVRELMQHPIVTANPWPTPVRWLLNMFWKRPQYHVFISHAGPDKLGLAHPIFDALRLHGIPCFLDVENLTMDVKPAAQLMYQAMGEAQIGIIILSPEYAARKWTMIELHHFLQRNAGEIPSKWDKPILLPVFYRLGLNECETVYREDSIYRDLLTRERFFTEQRQAHCSTPQAAKALRELTMFSGVEMKRFGGGQDLSSAEVVNETVWRVLGHSSSWRYVR